MEEVGRVIVGGVVRDAAGAPIAGARVCFTAAPVPLPDIAAITDAHGRFTLTAPRPGRYEMAAFTDAGSAVATIQAIAPDTRVDLVVE